MALQPSGQHLQFYLVIFLFVTFFIILFLSIPVFIYLLVFLSSYFCSFIYRSVFSFYNFLHFLALFLRSSFLPFTCYLSFPFYISVLISYYLLRHFFFFPYFHEPVQILVFAKWSPIRKYKVSFAIAILTQSKYYSAMCRNESTVIKCL
jgi:hypothetical protein